MGNLRFSIELIWAFCILSTGFAVSSLEILREATGTVSDAFISYLELLIIVLPRYSATYALFEVVSEMGDDPTAHKDVLKLLPAHNIKCLSALAICAAIFQYFGFSFPWISALAVAVWQLADEVKSDFVLSRTQLSWLSVLALLFSRHFFISLIISVISYFHVAIVAPYFKNLIARSSMAASAYEQRMVIEFVGGILASAIASRYFTFEYSEHLMFASTGLGMACFCIFALVNPSTDFGIIQFLFTWSIQCGVNLFGLLHFQTLMVLVVGCTVIYLRWKFGTVSAKTKIGGGKWRPNLHYVVMDAIFMFACQEFCIVSFKASGINVHTFLSYGSLTLVFMAYGRRLDLTPERKICASVWEWSHGNGNGNSILFFYHVHLMEILQFFLIHSLRYNPNYDLYGRPRPPV